MNITIEEIVNNVILNIEEVVSTYTIEVSEMQVPGVAGKSAYQSAVDGGFVGTELEFNQSLAEVLPHIENTSNPHNVSATQVGLGNVDNTSDANKPVSTATQTALNAKENTVNKGASLGYTPLDVNQKVPLENINDALLGNVHYQGLWNASTNTPNLDVVENKGHYYICTNTVETTRYGIVFNTGDWIISDGVNWGKVDNTDAVSSVFGRIGNITAQSGDYTTAQVTETTNKNYQTDNQKLFNDATSSIQTQLNSKATGTGTANGTNTGDQDLSPYVKNIVKNAVQGANITGTVLDVILYSQLIPANSFKEGDFMELFSRVGKIGVAGSINHRVRINSSNTLTGATFLAVNFASQTNIFMTIKRTFNISGGNLICLSNSLNVSSDLVNNTNAPQSIAFNREIDNYIFITGQLSSSADTMYHLGTKITN